MDLKEFRKCYGQDMSLSVCQRAYGYVLNGHDPKPSIATASILYAKDFTSNPTPVIGYRAEQEIGCVRIYKLMTETISAQSSLQKGVWNYGDQSLCIARLGENYVQELANCLTFPDDLIVSVYNHDGKHISVVALEGCKKVSQIPVFKHIGHILALNALGYYDRYLDNLVLIEQYKEKTSVNFFEKFFFIQPIEFTDKRYFDQRQLFPKRTESVRKYLARKSEELNTSIRIASIEIFGNFTDF